MANKNYRPTSAGMRFRTGLTFDEVTKKTPDKGLRESIKHHAAGVTTPVESRRTIVVAGTSVFTV